jgi:two-component system, OmpR family, sensor histidine kinase CreC
MVKIRTRLFAAFVIVVGVGFCALVYWILRDLRPRHLATMEESMVDTAILLASLVENNLDSAPSATEDLRQAFARALRRDFSAQIYEMTKTGINTRVYVTDARGVVVFDSDHGRDEGMDYSRWNDVVRTLRGDYGARATRSDPADWTTEVLYVGAPIRRDGSIVGVLTVAKPSESVAMFVKTARVKIAVAGGVAAVAVVLMGMVSSVWITRPIEKLTQYARAVRDGARVTAPAAGRDEIGELGRAFEEMRAALEGKQYVEDYVQVLTHQLKSPLSAIRGAAELLDEEMAPEQRRHFLSNLRSETGRIQDLVDRMLQLAALENRNELRDAAQVALGGLLRELAGSMAPLLAAKQLAFRLECESPVEVRGERFLLRQAISNLVENAIDFSPAGGTVTAVVEAGEGVAAVAVSDEGSGIPEYALDKVFERFYSLPRADTGRKSSGLGLAFVKEVAELHEGRVTVENRPGGGATATLTLPMHATPSTR